MKKIGRSRKGREGREKSKQEEKQIFGRLDEEKKGNERRRKGMKEEGREKS